MRHFGRLAQMEAVDAFLDQAIGVRDPLVLAQMLHPRCDKESFDDASFIGGILEHAPAIGAVAAPLMSEVLEGLEKLLPILRTNAVFDRDQDWPAVLVDGVRRERRR